MKRDTVAVDLRTVFGKKLKQIREDGLLPANVYGKKIDSIAVQLPVKEFKDLYKKVRETGLIDLTVDGKKLPVLIHRVQIDPLTREPIHADFFNVNLKEKITSNVPIITIGEPLAVADKKGVLLQLLSELEVEALPADLPEHIEVNVESLAEVNDQLTVGEIIVPESVTIKNEPDQQIFRIGELVTKEAEEQEALEAAEAEEQKEEGETQESTEETSEQETPTAESSEE